jgi:hypothetical protein
MIWKMTVSMWSSWRSIWDVLSLCSLQHDPRALRANRRHRSAQRTRGTTGEAQSDNIYIPCRYCRSSISILPSPCRYWYCHLRVIIPGAIDNVILIYC